MRRVDAAHGLVRGGRRRGDHGVRQTRHQGARPAPAPTPRRARPPDARPLRGERGRQPPDAAGLGARRPVAASAGAGTHRRRARSGFPRPRWDDPVRRREAARDDRPRAAGGSRSAAARRADRGARSTERGAGGGYDRGAAAVAWAHDRRRHPSTRAQDGTFVRRRAETREEAGKESQTSSTRSRELALPADGAPRPQCATALPRARLDRWAPMRGDQHESPRSVAESTSPELARGLPNGGD